MRTLAPVCSAMPETDQAVVPVAVPEPPRSLVQVTWVTPTLSAAVPPSARGVVLAVNVAAEVGVVMATVGAVVSGAV